MRFISLSIRNAKEIYRDPVPILLGLGMPIALLVLFSSIYSNIKVEMFSPESLTPGIIIFCFSFLLMFSASLLAGDKDSSLLIRLFTTPLRASDFILSYLIPFLPLALLQMILCLITGTILGATFQNIVLSCLIFFLVAFICISIGMVLGSLCTVNQVSGIGSVLITIISLFCGAWTPLNIMGGIFKSVGYALPFAHAVDASRKLSVGSSIADVWGNIFIILIYTFVLVTLAILSFRWRMKKDSN